MPEYYEGQIVKNSKGVPYQMVSGSWIPVSNAGPAGLSGAIGAGSKKYQERVGTRLADLDVDQLAEITQLRNNANALAANAAAADELLRSKQNLTGPLFGPAKTAARFNPLSDKQRLTNMTQFEKLAAEGVLENVKKLPGPLSEKELAFLSRMTYDPEGLPEENLQTAKLRRTTANKLTKYAQAQQAWIDRFGSLRAKGDNGLNFNDFWSEWSKSLDFSGESVKRKQNVKPSWEKRQVPQAQPRPQAPTQGRELVYNPATGRVE
jgi:hypothetical protein